MTSSSSSPSSEELVAELQKKKEEATRLRIKTERQIEKIYSSVILHSVDNKLELERESLSLTSNFLSRRTCQLESIERLTIVAKERLAQEQEAAIELGQKMQSAEDPEIKQGIEDWLHITNDHILELESEIKRRQKAAERVSKEVAGYSDAKSETQKQISSNLSLRQDITGNADIDDLVEKLQEQVACEESIKKALAEASSSLEDPL